MKYFTFLSSLILCLFLISCDKKKPEEPVVDDPIVEEPKTFTITFYDSDTILELDLNSYTEGEEVLLPEATKDGMIFNGWHTDKDLYSNKVIKINKDDTGDKVFYASFSNYPSLFLSFNHSTEVEYLREIDPKVEYILPIPERSGYHFSGWYNNSSFLGDPIEAIPEGNMENHFLHAKWVVDHRLLDQAMLELSKNVIERNVTLPEELYHFELSWSSTDNIIDNKGTLRRPYDPQTFTLTALIKDDTQETEVSYELQVAGYKSLEAPIASGYILRNYHTVNDTFFQTLDIVNTAFAIADANGKFLASSYFGNVEFQIMPKAKELGVRVLMSVGPGTKWSDFSRTQEGLNTFANSIVDAINRYGFDGVDIDWETPSPGEVNQFIALIKLVYERVKENNPKHLVTAAIAGGKWQPDNYNLNVSKQYLDYINMMTYDMSNNGGNYQGPLYPNNTFHDPVNRVGKTYDSCSIEESIEIYNNEYGVPNSKILIGIPFYGRMQTRTYNESTNTYGPWNAAGSIGYHYIEDTKLNNPDLYTVKYDDRTKAAYIINKDGTEFISYDNPRSIRDKASYVFQEGLAGMMYWEHYHDGNYKLLSALKMYLRK